MDLIEEPDIQQEIDALKADMELASMFVTEALDHLGSIEASLLRLEDAPGDRRLIDEVFRPFHTIKGNAGVLGVASVQAVAHQVENLLDQCRAGKRVVGAAEIDVVLKAVDVLTGMLNDISAMLAGQQTRSREADRVALLTQIGAVLDGGGTEPLLHDAGASGAPAELAGATSSESAGDTQASVKVDTRKLDGLVDTVGELVILQALIAEDILQTRAGDERLGRNLAQLRRITSELQRGATSMRMVPIRQTFRKMARLVRDVSRKAGKNVELTLVGEDTELDRKVVEDIGDPLMHMVRNSVDHGIESPAARAAAGKPEDGTLTLRAFHQAGSIVIEVADDGAGLDTERIRRKAIERGLIAADVEMSDADVRALIFAPGFSTAEQITEISGRGVGMDVVRRNIEALRGRIDIESTPGRGTTFSIRLPLTLAILDGMLVTSGGERFVIPTYAICESLRPKPEQVRTMQGVPRLIQVRDALLPLLWLSDLLTLPGPRVDPSEGAVVVIEDNRQRIGIVVERLVGKQEVVVKSLGADFTNVDGIAGGAILGDGRIGLIVDAHGVGRLMRGDSAMVA